MFQCASNRLLTAFLPSFVCSLVVWLDLKRRARFFKYVRQIELMHDLQTITAFKRPCRHCCWLGKAVKLFEIVHIGPERRFRQVASVCPLPSPLVLAHLPRSPIGCPLTRAFRVLASILGHHFGSPIRSVLVHTGLLPTKMPDLSHRARWQYRRRPSVPPLPPAKLACDTDLLLKDAYYM